MTTTPIGRAPDLLAAAAACDHRRCTAGEPATLRTPANVVTAVRTVASLALFGLALVQASVPLLLGALAVYWVGDVLDGQVARLTGTETRTGAVVDILCDRLGCATFYIAWAAWHPETMLPVGIFLLQFMVLDSYVSLAFQRWPLRSPNYFFLVDRRIWALNWSAPAKALNSAALAVALVVLQSVALATVIAVAVLAVKAWAFARLHHLPVPDGGRCMAAVAVAR